MEFTCRLIPIKLIHLYSDFKINTQCFVHILVQRGFDTFDKTKNFFRPHL